jgi:hypothetical protein
MSGRRARRLAARLRRMELTQAEWDAWHNPPCPDVEEIEIDAITRCVTLTNPEEDE